MVSTLPSILKAFIGSNQVLKLWAGILSLMICKQLLQTLVQVFSIVNLYKKLISKPQQSIFCDRYGTSNILKKSGLKN